jgi:hypothetical protein
VEVTLRYLLSKKRSADGAQQAPLVVQRTAAMFTGTGARTCRSSDLRAERERGADEREREREEWGDSNDFESVL